MRCPILSKLPPPPTGRTGWPWTKASPQLPNTMPGRAPWPRISIVTPSYNQGEYIEETVRSVLLQGYPDLEYVIIDGGSTDDSVDIIRKYEPWLAYWVSETDSGQSHAINKGFRQTTGEVMAYLNSDDIYYPNVLGLVASGLKESDSDILIGGLNRVQINSGQIESVEHLSPNVGNVVHLFPVFANGRVEDFRCLQPSMFWRRAIWELAGEMDEHLHYMMDREWCLRALAKGARVSTTEDVLARFALHPGSKGQEHHLGFVGEMALIYRRFSRMPEFRRIPCLLASLSYRLTFLKDTCYAHSAELDRSNQRTKASAVLFAARVLRRAHRGMTGLARFQRARARKRVQ